MGYLFLGISLLAGVTKGFCGKKTSHFATDFRDAALVNVIRMLLCALVGFGIVLFGNGISALSLNGYLLGFSAMSGISTAFFAVTWLLSVRVGAYMLVDIALMCSVLVPVLGSLALFGEEISWVDLIGLSLLVGAVIMMCLYNNKTKAKPTVRSIVQLILCGIFAGLSDFSQKLYVVTDGTEIAAFNFYTYVFAFLALLILSLCLSVRKSERKEPLRLGGVLPYIVIMALCMFAASYFQTLAAQRLMAATLYPLARGGALLLSALMSRICFGEKWTRTSLFGMALAFAGLIVMNI